MLMNFIIAADDGVGLHYMDDELYRVVSSRQSARAYNVYKKDNNVLEEEITPIFLGRS
jgi:dipeptidase E